MGLPLIIGLVIAILVGLLVLAGVVLWLVGKGIPEEHTASSVIELPASCEEVYAVIDDVQSHPTWSSGVTKVDMMPDRSGLRTCRMSHGRNSFVLTRTRHEPPRIQEGTIQDDSNIFSGTWKYELKPVEVPGAGVGGAHVAGCEVKLTEVGRISWAMPRAIMKYFAGYHKYLDAHLVSLGKKFGRDVRPRRG